MIRRRYILIVIIITSSLWLLSNTAALARRGITVKLRANEKADAPVTEEVNLYSSNYALVIGIDNYTHGWPKLSGAVNDAKLVAEELQKKRFEVTLKTDLRSKELKQSFEEFFVLKGEDPLSRLFVWFAGHGHTLKGEGFLVPADAPRPDEGTQFRLKALSMRRFGEYVRLAQSKHAFAVFDSCFSGTIFNTQRSLPPAAITRATTFPVRQFLSSGDVEQTVSDDGTFRKLFIRAIRGEERADPNSDGYLTGSELGLFLTDRLTNLTNSTQTPRYGKLRDPDYDRGDFVFILPSAEKTSMPIDTPIKKKVSIDQERIQKHSLQKSQNRKLEVAIKKYKCKDCLAKIVAGSIGVSTNKDEMSAKILAEKIAMKKIRKKLLDILLEKPYNFDLDDAIKIYEKGIILVIDYEINEREISAHVKYSVKIPR